MNDPRLKNDGEYSHAPAGGISTCYRQQVKGVVAGEGAEYRIPGVTEGLGWCYILYDSHFNGELNSMKVQLESTRGKISPWSIYSQVPADIHTTYRLLSCGL